MNSTHKLVVTGWDGATWDLLDPLMRAGRMPNLKRLVERGLRGRLQSTRPNHTSAAWASFATGKNPGGHGIFEWLRTRDGYRTAKIVDSADIHGATFYESLGDRRICLVNLPLSSPARIAGDILASFVSKSPQLTYPASLAQSLDLAGFRMGLTGRQAMFDVADNVIDHFLSRRAAIRSLFERGYDFFFVLYSETDYVQHTYYDALEKWRPGDPPPAALRLYDLVDEELGWLLERIDPDTNLILISDHGFRSFPRVFYINEWLRQQGYLTASSTRTIKIAKGGNPVTRLADAVPPLKRLMWLAYQLVRPAIPSNVQLRIESHLSPDIDLERSRAFCPSSELGYIYLNDGRFRGVVPDADRESLKAEIIVALKSLPFVTEALPGEAYYRGGQAGWAPDILVRTGDCKVERTLAGRILQERTVNNHAEYGILVAAGPDFAAGAIEGAQMIDLAPTILYLLDRPVPSDMDGKVLTQLLKPDLLTRRLIVTRAAASPAALAVDETDGAGEEIVVERLQQLGYLE